MKAIRLWSARNAGRLKKCYAVMEGTLALFNPRLRAIGQQRLDRPFAALEGAVKGFLFDSQCCGQCTLGETGMAYRMEDRIGEIVTRSNALGDREPWRPAP
jgi:hypothetical protein